MKYFRHNNNGGVINIPLPKIYRITDLNIVERPNENGKWEESAFTSVYVLEVNKQCFTEITEEDAFLEMI